MSARQGARPTWAERGRKVARVGAAMSILALAVGVGFYRPLLTWAASRLVVVDPLQKADAIVVLAGERGERVEEGARLYFEGWAPRIVMSGGPSEADVTLASLMRHQAEGLGVPHDAIIEQGCSLDTGEDAAYTTELVRRAGYQRLILVTSPYHARRARWLFRSKMVPKGIEVLSRPARTAWFRPDGWWTRKMDTKVVLMEYFKGGWYLITGG